MQRSGLFFHPLAEFVLTQVSCRGWLKWLRRVPSWSARTSSERLSSASTTRSSEVAEMAGASPLSCMSIFHPNWPAFSSALACILLFPLQDLGSGADALRFSSVTLCTHVIYLPSLRWDVLHCSDTAVDWNGTKACWEKLPSLHLSACTGALRQYYLADDLISAGNWFLGLCGLFACSQSNLK